MSPPVTNPASQWLKSPPRTLVTLFTSQQNKKLCYFFLCSPKFHLKFISFQMQPVVRVSTHFSHSLLSSPIVFNVSLVPWMAQSAERVATWVLLSPVFKSHHLCFCIFADFVPLCFIWISFLVPVICIRFWFLCVLVVLPVFVNP